MTDFVSTPAPEYVPPADVTSAQETPVANGSNPGKRALPPLTVARIVRMAAEGKNAMLISKETGVSYPTVRKYMVDSRPEEKVKAKAKAKTKAHVVRPQLGRPKASPNKRMAVRAVRKSTPSVTASAPTQAKATMLPPPAFVAPHSNLELVVDVLGLASKHNINIRDLVGAVASAEKLQAAIAKMPARS